MTQPNLLTAAREWLKLHPPDVPYSSIHNGFLAAAESAYIAAADDMDIDLRPHYPPTPPTQDILERRRVTPERRGRILDRDKHRCQFCGTSDNLHIDHIKPIAFGGTSDDWNLQVLCAFCNLSKGSKAGEQQT